MSDLKPAPSPEQPGEFERQAAARRVGLLSELISFLGHNKKWWLLPIVLVIVALGGLMLLGGGPAAPFIYSLF